MHLQTVTRLRLACVLALWIFLLPASAQSVANYAVTRSTGITYSSIVNTGTPCNSWRYIGGFQQDDNRSNPIEIGFDFWYNGVRYTEVNISTNGYIDFSTSANNGGPTTAAYGYDNSQYTNPTGTLNAIAPFYDDQTTQGAVDPLGNSIRTLLTGTAPNRVMTIEWIDMAVYLNTTPSLNYQVKIYESTGLVQFLYGTMTLGTANFTYTCGINAATQSNVATAAQLKCQQTANTAAFNNGEVNNLTTLPASNSRIAFTPPVPANPTAGTLTFSNVQAAQMTLNWPNWASNEVGYVIYSSTDNVNFEFETQTAANATSATITGLYSGTTYYWRVYAVTEGCLSSPLTGTRATLPGTTFTSVTSGNWGNASTWNTGTVPTVSDNVIIASAHMVTINTNAVCHNLTVGQGGAAVLQIGNNNFARSLTVDGAITVNPNATLRVNTLSNTTHTMNCYGNITNYGTFDMQPDGNSKCNVSFLHPYSTQTVSGTGTTFRFNNITVNKSAGASKAVIVSSSVFTAAAGFLTLNEGTFKLATTGAVNVTPYNANATLDYGSKLWISSNTATVNMNGSLDLFGDLVVSGGTVNIGNAANLGINSNGGQLVISGGTVNVAGRYDRPNTTCISRFTISGGTLVLNTMGSTSTTNAPFMMDIPGSQFTQSGGTIIIRREGGTGAQDLGFVATGGNINSVTGGVLQIGDASTPVGQTMTINTVSPVGNLRVASANATAKLATNPLTVYSDVQLQAGTFNANNLNVTLGGNWTNTGGTYTPGTNTTTFSGTAAQTISRTSGAETFNHLVFMNAGVKTAASNFNCQNLAVNAGATLSAGSPGYTIGVKGNWSNNGTFVAGTDGFVICNGTAAQTIGGTALTTFRHLTINNSAGVALTADENIHGTLTLSLGNFTTTGRNFTLLSDSTGTARIGTITSGNITGNIIMQRFIYLGPTQWRQLCAPVTGNTLQGWNDDLVTAGFPGSDYPNLNGFYSVATYNETVAGPKENGYSPPTNITDALTAKKGYFVYVGPLNVALDVTGPPVKMNQSFTLTYTPSAGPTQDGWNMLGNPYPSALNWDAAGWTRTNTDNVLYIWNPALGQYASYVGGVGVNGGTKMIPSSQAFWVRAIGASPAMSLTENVKAASDPSFFRTAAQPDTTANLLSLSLHRGNMADQTIIRFNDQATPQFDIGMDAMKLASMDTTVPYLSSIQDSANELSINTLPVPSADIVIPLRVKAGITGTHTIMRDTITDLPHSMCITLEDLYTGIFTQLSAGASYTFYLSDTTNAPRFLLHFGPALTKGQILASCSNSADGKAYAKGTGNGPWDYTWKDSNGNVITTHNAVTGTDTLFGLTPGDYVVEVDGNNGFCTQRIDTITVDGPVPVYALGNITAPVCTYTNDGAVHLTAIGGGTPPYQLLWPDGNSTDSIMNIAQGTYPLQVTDGNGCIDSIQFAVNSSSTLSASFVATPDTVYVQQTASFANYSSGGTNFYWEFGDTSGISSDANPFYTYNSNGTYTVTLIADDGNCQDTTTGVITVLTNTTGIHEQDANGNIQVASSQPGITVFFHFAAAEVVNVELYDASGKLLAQQKQSIMDGRIDLPLGTASAGMYTVVVERNGKRSAYKVIRHE